MDYVDKTDRRRTSVVQQNKKRTPMYFCVYVIPRTHRRQRWEVGAPFTTVAAPRRGRWKIAYK